MRSDCVQPLYFSAVIVSCARKPASRLSPHQGFGVERRALSSRRCFLGLPPIFPIALNCSAVSFLARAFPPMRANCVMVSVFTPPLYRTLEGASTLSPPRPKPLIPSRRILMGLLHSNSIVVRRAVTEGTPSVSRRTATAPGGERCRAMGRRQPAGLPRPRPDAACRGWSRPVGTADLKRGAPLWAGGSLPWVRREWRAGRRRRRPPAGHSRPLAWAPRGKGSRACPCSLAACRAQGRATDWRLGKRTVRPPARPDGRGIRARCGPGRMHRGMCLIARRRGVVQP